MRKEERELAFCLVYESLFNEVNIENSFLSLEVKDGEYAKKILETYLQNKSEIETKLSQILVGYDVNRVYKIDLALLCVSLTEIFYLDVPPPVGVNECIELAKKYSTDKSPSFLNGVLAGLLKNK